MFHPKFWVSDQQGGPIFFEEQEPPRLRYPLVFGLDLCAGSLALMVLSHPGTTKKQHGMRYIPLSLRSPLAVETQKRHQVGPAKWRQVLRRSCQELRACRSEKLLSALEDSGSKRIWGVSGWSLEYCVCVCHALRASMVPPFWLCFKGPFWGTPQRRAREAGSRWLLLRSPKDLCAPSPQNKKTKQ